jgi:hypothetical protein
MATTRRADMFIDLEDDPRENGSGTHVGFDTEQEFG